MYSLPAEDLENIFSRVSEFWPREKSFLLTGGTGFFGRWLTESISYIENKVQSKNTYTVISRQPKTQLLEKLPVLKETFFVSQQLDLTEYFKFDSSFDYVMHAAGDVTLVKSGELMDFADMVKGTSNLIRSLDISNCRFMYVSSGSVYGHAEGNTTEEHLHITPTSHIDSYSEGKRQAEYLVKKVNNHAVARCFSFVGPYADPNMVAMDMLINKSKNLPVNVNSPAVVRSFMYPTDLVVSLFTILLKPGSYSEYNVGSSIPVSLGELAEKIAALGGHSQVALTPQPEQYSLAGHCYYPNTDRYNSDYGPILTVSMDEALQKTYNFLIQRKPA